MEDQTWRRIIAGSIIGAAIGLAGFFFALHGTQGMGVLIFFAVPATGGFVIGFFTRAAKAAGISACIALLLSLVLLIAMGKEGPLCALMALVLIAVPIAVGAALGVAVRALVSSYRRQNTTVGMFILLAPACLFLVKHIEQPRLERTRTEVVTNSILVPDSVESTWADIQSIDSLHGRKPWLMYAGLPIPQRCTLEGRGIGAHRTCYFDKGYIEETVTEWEPPDKLGMVVDRTHMPGRHWMGFESASYQLQAEGGGTRLTRTTVITSRLYPAWYWRRLERWGVSSEHVYILNDVAGRKPASAQ